MNFSLLTPPAPELGTPFWGAGQSYVCGGWGRSNFFAYCGHCVVNQSWVLKIFFLVRGSPGSRVQTAGSHPPYGPLLVRT